VFAYLVLFLQHLLRLVNGGFSIVCRKSIGINFVVEMISRVLRVLDCLAMGMYFSVFCI